MTEPDPQTPDEAVDDLAAVEPVAEAGDAENAAEPQQAEEPEAVVEGPRRRARRERAERREAQARATAIEQARREAKRAARGRGAADSTPVARGTVRGLKLFLLSLMLVVSITGIGSAFERVLARCSSGVRPASSSASGFAPRSSSSLSSGSLPPRTA